MFEKNNKIAEYFCKTDLNKYENSKKFLEVLKIIQSDLIKEKYPDGKYVYGKLASTKEMRFCVAKAKIIVKISSINSRKSKEWAALYWSAMLFLAPYNLDSFMIYMEKNRPANERFYLPRRKVLKQVADAIQELADDLLDELFINMPSRVGKTQIVKFGYLWFGSRNPELSNLYSAYSDKITQGFYTGIIELITDQTYTYNEIFPMNKIARSNGADEIIDLNRTKTYPTFTCRSIYGTLNGACDCVGLAVADDLLSGIEEALSVDRLDTVWGKFDNNFMQRLKRKAKLINMGTRWALRDPQGRRRELLESSDEYKDRRYKVICIPALNDDDESNFDYPYDLGYSTQDYKQRRASFEANDDMASWFAQAMQTPIERQGALFSSGSMRYYNGVLPEGKPDRIFMAVDEAFGGGDYVSAPVCYQYNNDYYIHDVVFDPGDKFVTRPKIADIILKHGIQAACFEETKTTNDYHEWIEKKLKEAEYRCNITAKPAPGNTGKRNRIFDKAPEIREMYFLDDGHRTKEYQKFIQNIYSFKMEGKVKHDDGPDSMAQLCAMKIGGGKNTQIVDRRLLGL